MAGKFMSLKKVIIPVMTLIILASQLTGCAVMKSDEMVHMIDNGEAIVLEVAKPDYQIKIKGTQETSMNWVQLDQLKTSNEFRQDFDRLLNINIVTENGINGKSGCIFVDSSGDRNGNTTFSDAFRNKVFINKYWKNGDIRSKLGDLANQVYTDVSGNDSYELAASLNEYYNLLPDATNPSSFNPTQSLSREQFYTLVFRSEVGVKIIEADENFEDAVGGSTEFTKYAQGVDEHGFLSVANKSLDGNSYKGSISRAEAIYMIVNQHFQKELSKVGGKEKAFKDTKNGGDIALKLKFKQKDGNKEIVGKERWQSYTLAYMLQNPDQGMQEELYKAMVVAKNVGILGGEESRWDEPISKAEAIQLIANTHIAKNKLYGYLSEVEYGKINIDKFTNNTTPTGKTEDGREYGNGWVEVKPEQVPSNPNKKLSSGITLKEAKDMLMVNIRRLTEDGYNKDEIDSLIAEQAVGLGTTMTEINSLPDESKPVITETPTKPAPTTKPGTKPTPKPGTGGNQNSGGGQVIKGNNPLDKNNNGIEDDIEGMFLEGGGTTQSDPDFNLNPLGEGTN